MAYAEPYRPSYEVAATSPDERRSVAKWMLGFLATCALFGTLSTLVVFQMTGAAAAKQSLRQATAALTELDASLSRRHADLQAAAEESVEGEILTLPDFPIAVQLTRDEVLGSSRDELRMLILDRSADRLYEDGTGALREEAEGTGSLGMFSIAGFTDRLLGLLTEDMHRLSGILVVCLGVVAGILTVAASAAARSWGRLVTAGAIVGLAGSGLLIAGAMARWYASSQSGGDYLRSEMFGITANHAMLAIRNGAAFALAGVAMMGIGLVLGALTRRT